MAQALSAHLLAAEGSGSSPARLAAARATTAAVLLEGVHVARAHSHREQLALGVALPELLRARGGRVRLVVLDSVAFHFRHGFGADYGARTRALLAHGLALLRASVEHDCAVVVVNQVGAGPVLCACVRAVHVCSVCVLCGCS
jgi:RAD51-like protein 2